jgi:APA family basic amino acid/polyamine antiporter
MNVVFGNAGAALVAAMIVICTLGANNGNTMSVARVTYAMGKDKVFLPWAGKEHKRFQTPGNALWLHCIWVIILIISSSFDILADMMVFISWIAYGLGAIGVFILRRKMPDKERPYKIPGHPFTTLAFIVFTAIFLIITVYNDITNYLKHQQPVVNSLLGI